MNLRLAEKEIRIRLSPEEAERVLNGESLVLAVTLPGIVEKLRGPSSQLTVRFKASSKNIEGTAPISWDLGGDLAWHFLAEANALRELLEAYPSKKTAEAIWEHSGGPTRLILEIDFKKNWVPATQFVRG